jgi:hypothetical protein
MHVVEVNFKQMLTLAVLFFQMNINHRI